MGNSPGHQLGSYRSAIVGFESSNDAKMVGCEFRDSYLYEGYFVWTEYQDALLIDCVFENLHTETGGSAFGPGATRAMFGDFAARLGFDSSTIINCSGPTFHNGGNLSFVSTGLFQNVMTNSTWFPSLLLQIEKSTYCETFHRFLTATLGREILTAHQILGLVASLGNVST